MLILLFNLLHSITAQNIPWPSPNATLRPTFHLGGLDNAPGYSADANGMMFRRVPWTSPTNQGGLFHVAWQCFRNEPAAPPSAGRSNSGLNWCHSTSSDFVTWKPLPPMFNYTGGGAESGGVAQLSNGDVIAIFNQIKGGGHWQAHPLNISDPYLTHWIETNPDGTSCDNKPCIATPGIPGTDLSQPYLDGSNDGYWRVVADRGHGGGGTGAAMLAKTKDFTSFEIESTYHEYKWTRCIDLPAECGFGPYPRDPNTFLLDPKKGIWIFYGMQKTCSFSGREFYVLGTYVNHSFVPLDKKSDYANNVFDGGEGYASMHVYDPIKDRYIWMTAVIEGDRDACGGTHGEGFWRSWMIERDIGRGWFGTLGLPRVLSIENLTEYYKEDESTAVHLLTPPLPELKQLRDLNNYYILPINQIPLKLSPNEIWNGKTIKFKNSKNKKETKTDATTAAASTSTELPRGQAMEYVLNLTMQDISQTGSDVGLQIFWDGSSTHSERTMVGIRDGTYLHGIDLWDQVNGDIYISNTTTSIENCRQLCITPPKTVPGCTAWTYSKNNSCRLKQHAQHALQVASDNGAFLPYHEECVSGYIHSSAIQYLSLYVDRTNSTRAVPITNTNYSYPNFNYSKLLIVIKDKETVLDLRVFIDGSIVEAFAMQGRSVVTARVYPSRIESERVAIYNRGTSLTNNINVKGFAAWRMKTALAATDIEEATLTMSPNPDPEHKNHGINLFQDPRDITNGIIMLEQIYTDQPYCTQIIVHSQPIQHRWVCVVTVNNYISKNGRSEGGYGEHVVSIYSDDLGQTWSDPASIELAPPAYVPNAYGIIVSSKPLVSLNHSSRLYSVYNLNYDNITNVTSRNDELGYFYMKWSNDQGVSWSKDRKKVPYPKTWIDRNNKPFQGSTNIMWTVDQIKTTQDGTVMFAFTKIGSYVQNPPEEIYIMSSTNLLTEENPENIIWTMLPENQDHGIQCPLGYDCNTTVMEEGHVLPLSTITDRTVIMARTSMGYLASATRDSVLQPIANNTGTTGIAKYWNNTNSALSPTNLTPLKGIVSEQGIVLMSGVKHPRGPFTPKEIAGMPGIYLLLFYNNAGGGWYGRDPYFLSCGRETLLANGEVTILWSQPEIILYDSEYRGGTSGGGYPDFIFTDAADAGGGVPNVYITTAQKGIPHPAKSRSYLIQIDPSIIQGLLTQHIASHVPTTIQPILSLKGTTDMNTPTKLKQLPATGTTPETNQQGFTIIFTVENHGIHALPGNQLISHDYMDLTVGGDVKNVSSLHLNFSYIDGRGSNFQGRTNEMCTGILVAEGKHQISIVADGGANIVSFVIDGVYCDASWSWIPPTGMRDIPESNFTVYSKSQEYGGTIDMFNVYDRALRTSEIIAMYRTTM